MLRVFQNLFRCNALFLVLMLTAISERPAFAAEKTFSFGFAKAEITPEVPLRLSGYGNRATVYEGIDEPLYVRAVVIKTHDQQICSLVSVDSIGFAGSFVERIARQVKKEYGMNRDQLVVCSTHSHTRRTR